MSIIEIDKKYVAGTYKRFPVEIVSGKGSIVSDSDGNEYIDMGSGIGVTSFGIGDDIWKEAVIAQLNKVQHMSNLYYTEPGARLAEMLCNKTGMKKVFFANSGAEANECAIKVARKYSQDKYDKNRNIIVTLTNSFHGRTLTTLAATGQEHYHELFSPLTAGFKHIKAGNIDELVKIIACGNICAVMIECVQGEGGVIALDGEYIKAVREITEKNDVLMIVDEVQTGNGRTGKMYAYMNFGIQPDIVSTAKGIGGGLPLGAVLLNEKVKDVLGFGDHGSTFGGNPIATAGALSIVSRLTDEFLDEVRKKSEYVFSAFEGSKGIESVSGLGLMIGIKTTRPAATVVSECIDEGVLCLTAKDKVRLLPALNIPLSVLSKAVEIIKKVCAKEESI